MTSQILVLPAYEPSPMLPQLVRTLSDAFAAVVVVDDADSQHLADDIRRVAAASAAHPDCVTLGVRTFGGRP